MAIRTVEIRDVEDAYTFSGSSSDTNFGRINKLYIRQGAYIKCNLYKYIPVDATITSLKLIVYFDYVGTNSYIDLFEILGDWTENTITFNNRPKTGLLKNNILYVPQSTSKIQAMIIELTNYIYQFQKQGIMLSTRSKFDVNIYSNDGNPQLYFEAKYTTDKPQQPNTISPVGGEILNKNSTVKFEWESTNQANYEMNYSTDNVNWSAATGTTNKYHNFNISSLSKGKFYWRVRYKDNDGVWSMYSPTVVCIIGERPGTPTITINRNKVNWGYNNKQVKFQVQLIKNGSIIEDSEKIYSLDNQYTLKTTLQNNTTYTVKVRIIDNLNMESLWGQKTFTTNYIEPLQPHIQLSTNNIRGSITIKCIKPTSGEPTIYFNIFRKAIDSNYIKIAQNVTDEYTDHTPQSNISYSYKIRGFTASGGYKDSLQATISVKIKDSQLAIVGEYDKYINLKYNPQRQLSNKLKGATIMFAGRKKPVIELSEHIIKEIKLSFLIRSDKELNTLLQIIEKRKTLLYRDSRQRKKYCSITGINYSDNKRIGEYEVSFTAIEVDYNEVVI